MLLESSLTQKLIRRVNIAKVISDRFELRQTGNRYLKGVLHDSLVVDTYKNIFYWNSLDINGDVMVWLTEICGLSYKESLLELKKFSDLPFERIIEEFETAPTIYPKLLDVFFELGKQYRSYWYDRGFSDETIDTYKLGYSGNCYTLPVIEEGTLKNFQCRVGNGEDKKIWRWVKEAPVGLFGVDQLPDSGYILMAEGPMDVLALHELGLPGMAKENGLVNWDKEWNKYIVKYNQVFILFDKDDAGRTASIRLSQRLLNRGYILQWPEFEEEKFDINKCMLKYGKELTRRIILEGLLPNPISGEEIAGFKNKVALSEYLSVNNKLVTNTVESIY